MAEKNHSKESDRLNASVIFSLQILDYLENAGSAPLAELSDAIRINKSRIIRLCGTMEHMGYLIHHDDGLYVLGPRLLSLGKAFERFNPLLQVVRPVISSLSRELKENVVFHVIRNNRRLCVCAVQYPGSTRYVMPEGSEAKFPYGASSHVLLTWGPAELRAQVLNSEPYTRYTPNTIVSAQQLLEALSRVLTNGYALSVEERTYGTAALAVPVFGTGGALIGSIGLASTVERITPEFIKEAVPTLQKAASYVQSMTSGAKKFKPQFPRLDR